MPQQESNISRFLKRSFLWTISACGVIFLVAMLAFQQNITQHRIRFRYVPAIRETPDKKVEDTVDIMRSRLNGLSEEFGLSDTAVTHSGNIIDVRFSTRVDVKEILFWITMPGHVTLALLHPDIRQPLETPLEEVPKGYTEKVYTKYMYRLSRPGDLKTEKRKYVVTDKPLMEIDQFERVEFSKVGLHSRTQLTFKFKPDDAEQFHDITALNYGRHMAMMVDGRLFFPPKEIGGAVKGGVVRVSGYFYNPPLRKLVKVLNTGALPGTVRKIAHHVY